MKLISGQRKEDQLGQHAPQILDCISSVEHKQNPSYLNSQLEMYQKESHWQSLEIIDVELGSDVLQAILRSNQNSLKGVQK